MSCELDLWKGHGWSVWLVYVLFVRLVEGAWLVSVVSICLVCKTWGRGMVCQCG